MTVWKNQNAYIQRLKTANEIAKKISLKMYCTIIYKSVGKMAVMKMLSLKMSKATQ